MTSQILDFAPFPLLQSAFDHDEDVPSNDLPAKKSIENVTHFVHGILIENGWTPEQAKEIMVVTDEGPNLSFG